MQNPSLKKIHSQLNQSSIQKNEFFYDLLQQDHDFYEGAYVNSINYTPSNLTFISRFIFWVARSGYVHHVTKYIPQNSTVLELGCGGGVKFFGKFYQTIGMDLSSASLQNASLDYEIAVRGNALESLPFPDKSLDGVISSFFWEHIDEEGKKFIFKEIHRVLKPKGKIVFLFDVETENPFIRRYKNRDPELYKKTFLDVDDHVGYTTPRENIRLASVCGFDELKSFYNEKTIFQEYSVNTKLLKWGSVFPISRFLLKINKFISGHKLIGKFYIIFLRILDVFFGFLPNSWCRTMTMVLEKR